MSPESTEHKPPASETLEMKRYQEDLAKEYGLPSPFQTASIKKLCEDMTASGMVPAHFNNNAMAVYLAAMRGRELGLDPMESIMETFWAMPLKKWNKETRREEERGTVMGMYSNKMLDIMHRRGIATKFVVETADRCEILFTPPNNVVHEPYTATFEYAEAIKAGLTGNDYSPWTKWPRAMCRARAISIGWRSMNGVVGKGANLYSKEELEDEYETARPADGDSPEVQSKKEEPAAKAGRKLKEGKTIDVKAETAPAETAKPVETPEPAKPAEEKPAEPAWAPEYFVMSSEVKIPAIDKVQPEPIKKLNFAALVTGDLPKAMKTSDQATAATGISHYVLTFDQNQKASVLHTSKLPDAPKPATTTAEKRLYIAVPRSEAKAATSADEIAALAISQPHESASTVEMMAQSHANSTGKHFLVLYKTATGGYELQSEFAPPDRSTPPPVPEESKTQAPDPSEAAVREELKGKHEYLKKLLPESVPKPQRATYINAFLKAYLGISDIKEFSSDLVKAGQSLDACMFAIKADPLNFLNSAERLGREAREKTPPFVTPVETPAPAADMNGMAKYYAERGWSGITTSLSEKYRHSLEPDPIKFQNILKFSGIESLPEKDASAYFYVALAYDKDTSTKFGLACTNYNDTLRQIRDRFDGKELKDIPAGLFLDSMTKVLAGEEEEPNLFGGK